MTLQSDDQTGTIQTATRADVMISGGHQEPLLLLEAPPTDADTNNIPAGENDGVVDTETASTIVEVGGKSVRLDALGPMVINSDGTISRISNWHELSELERTRTLRVLSARNKIRLANEEKKLLESGSDQSATMRAPHFSSSSSSLGLSSQLSTSLRSDDQA